MEFPENDQLMFWAEVTDDDRYLVVSIVEGTENKNRLWVYPIISGERSELGEPDQDHRRSGCRIRARGFGGRHPLSSNRFGGRGRAAGRCRS